MEITGTTDLGATGTTGKTETDSQNNNKKLSIKTEEATNMEADTEVIGVLVLQQQAARGREGGASAARTEEMEEKKEPKTSKDKNRSKADEAGLQQHLDKQGAAAAHTDNNRLMEGTKSYKGIKCGQGIVIEGWDHWDDYDLEEENIMDDEELIKQRSFQSFQRRKKELNTIDTTEKDKNSTMSEEGERDSRRLEKE